MNDSILYEKKHKQVDNWIRTSIFSVILFQTIGILYARMCMILPFFVNATIINAIFLVVLFSGVLLYFVFFFVNVIRGVKGNIQYTPGKTMLGLFLLGVMFFLYTILIFPFSM